MDMEDAAGLRAAAERLRLARAEQRAAMEQVRRITVSLVTHGSPVSTAARLAGVDRMTLLSWLGRR